MRTTVIARTILKIAVLACGAMSLGATCGGGGTIAETTSTIVIRHHGRTFTDTVGVNGTSAWGRESLAVSADDFSDPNTSFYIFGTKPRELYLFDVSLNAADGPWHPEVPVEYASVGALPLLPDGTPTAALNRADIPALSARVVDHGRCFTQLPLGAFSTKGLGFFPAIDGQLAQQLQQAGRDQGYETYNFERWYAPHFMHPTGASSAFNDDGFTLRVKWTFAKSCLADTATCKIDFEVRQSYAVYTANEFLHFASVTNPFVTVDPNTAATADGAIHLLSRFLFGVALLAPDGLSPEDSIAYSFRELPRLLDQAVLEKGSSDTILANCNARRPDIGDAQCATFGPGVGGTLSARTAITAALSSAYVGEGLSLSEANAKAADLVRAFDVNQFWCKPKPAPRNPDPNVCPQVPQEDPDLSGTCQFHPAFRRVSVKPNHFDITWQNADEKDTPADITAARLLASDSAPSCDDPSVDRFPYGGQGTPLGKHSSVTRTYCNGPVTPSEVCPQDDPCAPCKTTYATNCFDLSQ